MSNEELDAAAGPTWDAVRGMAQSLAESRGDWAGYPIPLAEFPLMLEPRFPFPGIGEIDLSNELTPEEQRERRLMNAFDAAWSRRFEIVNEWISRSRCQRVVILRSRATGKILHRTIPSRSPYMRLTPLLNTMGASRVWDPKAEINAVCRLSEMISESAYRYYVMSGGFIETSPRSGVTYWFRKIFPTVALASTPSGRMKILTTLCMHPIGYYCETFAGCMAPTDDVIAHLIMMRADERKFWSKARQISPYEVASGL